MRLSILTGVLFLASQATARPAPGRAYYGEVDNANYGEQPQQDSYHPQNNYGGGQYEHADEMKAYGDASYDKKLKKHAKGTKGTGKGKKNGEACTPHAIGEICAKDLTCVVPTGATEGICRLINPLGGECGGSDSGYTPAPICHNGHECYFGGHSKELGLCGTCVAHRAVVGEPCGGPLNIQCHSETGLYCVGAKGDKKGTCKYIHSEGQMCSYDDRYFDYICGEGLDCVKGVCCKQPFWKTFFSDIHFD